MTINMGKQLLRLVSSEKKVKALRGEETVAEGKVSVKEDKVKVGRKSFDQKSVVSLGRDWIRIQEKK